MLFLRKNPADTHCMKPVLTIYRNRVQWLLPHFSQSLRHLMSGRHFLIMIIKTHQMIMQLFLQKAPLQKFVTSVPHRAVNRHRLPVCWAIKGFSSQTRFSHSVLKSFRRISKDSVYQMLLYAMRHLKTWQNSFHAFLIRLWLMLHAQVKECLEKTKRQ